MTTLASCAHSPLSPRPTQSPSTPLQALIRLPPKVSEDLFVLEFFEVTQEDITIP